MREMILNHASVAAGDVDAAVEVLRDLASGMASLRRSRCTSAVLRTKAEFHAIPVVRDRSLYDVLLELRRRNGVEEFRFISQLATKAPLTLDISASVLDRFLGCEVAEMVPADGEPLVLCAHLGAVSVSFPSTVQWDRDLLDIRFNELLPDDTLIATSEMLDNLARSMHAGAIIGRHSARTRDAISDAGSLWENRSTAFPHLLFGPDVESQLQAVNTGLIQIIVGRLAELDGSVGQWPGKGAAAPTWTCKVTPESDRVQQNGTLRDARRFRSISGSRKLFLWHARFGANGRIHLRVDSGTHTVEVGYIGVHLPL